jgi:hypothetical protein
VCAGLLQCCLILEQLPVPKALLPAHALRPCCASHPHPCPCHCPCPCPQVEVVAKHGPQISEAALHDMPYADAVVRETMRVTPIIAGFPRVALQVGSASCKCCRCRDQCLQPPPSALQLLLFWLSSCRCVLRVYVAHAASMQCTAWRQPACRLPCLY